jgi:hypothetical protein
MVVTNRRERETELRCQLFQPCEVPLLSAACNRLAFSPPLGITGRVGTATHRRALPVSAAASSAGPGRIRRVSPRRPPPAATGANTFASHSRRRASFFELARTLRSFAHRSTPLVVVFTQVSTERSAAFGAPTGIGAFPFLITSWLSSRSVSPQARRQDLRQYCPAHFRPSTRRGDRL